MTANFTNIPLEIRCNIYSYVLREGNVTYYDPILRRDVARYCDSLFTVNKQISEESREYFHNENVFIAVVVPTQELATTINSIFPSLINKPQFRHLALRLEVFEVFEHFSRSFKSRMGERVLSPVVKFSVRHLPLFVRVCNARFTCFTGRTNNCALGIRIHLEQEYFKGNSRYLGLVVNGLKGLRRVSRLNFDGNLQQDLKQEIEEHTYSTKFTFTEALMEARISLARSTAAYEAGRLPLARCKAENGQKILLRGLGYARSNQQIEDDLGMLFDANIRLIEFEQNFLLKAAGGVIALGRNMPRLTASQFDDAYHSAQISYGEDMEGFLSFLVDALGMALAGGILPTNIRDAVVQLKRQFMDKHKELQVAV